MSDVPVSALGTSLAAAIRQLGAIQTLPILNALAEDQVPLGDEALVNIWLPALEDAACRGFEPASSVFWDKARRLGILDRAWSFDRRPSLLTAIVKRGPDRPHHPDQAFWGHCVQEGLGHPVQDDFTLSVRVTGCSILLHHGLTTAADALVSTGLLDPLRAEIGFAHGPNEAGNFAWTCRHVDPTTLGTEGLPIWAHLARPGLLQGPPSTLARAWGYEHDPAGVERLARFEFFEALAAQAADADQLARHLISRPDWRDIRDHRGAPALWAAVNLNTSVLRSLSDLVPEESIPWTAKTEDGKDLWFAFMGATHGVARDALWLADHIEPSLDDHGSGWMCALSAVSSTSVALTTYRFIPEHLERWASVCWAGSTEDQDTLARHLFAKPWATENQTGLNQLMRSSVRGLINQPLGHPLSPALASFFAIWIAARDDKADLDPSSALSQMFPTSFDLPPIFPESAPPTLWSASHPWTEQARSRLRAWSSQRTMPAPATNPQRPRLRS